jgi:2,4-diketo-3-deoxy-L-fuconate hydrolase
MRIGNVEGRLKLLGGAGGVDVATASRGAFGPEPGSMLADLAGFRRWADSIVQADEAFDARRAGPPVSAPGQVFAIGLNYAAHAGEAGYAMPPSPMVFTKFQSSFVGAVADVHLNGEQVDWEVEVVVVIGQEACDVPAGRAWDYVAGLTVGQDLTDRRMQRTGSDPQFSLAKSFRGFSPLGPVLVTPDEFDNPDDLALGCELNGAVMQDARTTAMIFSIPDLISYLSSIVVLRPGDVIFTGTPDGVGVGREPPVFLQPGDRLRSWVSGIGQIEQSFVAGRATATPAVATPSNPPHLPVGGTS